MKLRILFIGDVMGKPGRDTFAHNIDKIRKEYAIDATIVNGENSSDQGRGITPEIVRFYKEHGVDVITSGNHIWYKRPIYSVLDERDDLLRPANYPSGAPGTGVALFECKGEPIAIINLQGRTFMREQVDCPFRTLESLLIYLRDKTKTIFIDFHAETTSEKVALAYDVDGKVSGVVGTHTHVQTADERVLPKGTAFISDLGMTGALNSLLGMKKEPIIHFFKTQLPVTFTVETEGPFVMSGVWIDVDTQTGKATAIERVRVIDDSQI